MASTIPYVLVTNVGGIAQVVANRWVQIKNNSSGTTYTSSSMTDANGRCAVPSVPAGIYTVYASNDGVTYSATTETNFIVPYTTNDQVDLLDQPQTLTGVKHFNAGATFDAGTVSFAVSPSFNAGATIKQLIFLPPPSGGDDFSVINTPLSITKNYVIASGGSYSTSGSLTPAQGATLEGLGFSADLNNINDPQWAPATEIKWNNAVGAPMVIPAANVNGVQIRNIGFDGNAQATKGIYGDRLTASVIENVGVRNLLRGTVGSGIALHLIATNNAIANQNAQHNRVLGFYGFCDEILRLEGSNPGAVGASNACHNNIQRLTGIFGNASTNSAGVTIIDADNNTGIDWFLFRSAGTGYGVDFQAAARNNYLYHLQASSGGVHVAAPLQTDFSNVIFGYDRGNGQPTPTIDAGGLLDWTETGHLAAGWNLGGKIATYNALATAGMGLSTVLVAPAPTLGLTSNATNLGSLTTPNDGVKHFYYVTCFARIGTLGSASFGLQVTYTDIGGSARTCTIPVCAEAGAFAAVCNTADDYKGSVMIGVNPNTLITVRTDPAGTYTGVTYAAGATITQVR